MTETVFKLVNPTEYHLQQQQQQQQQLLSQPSGFISPLMSDFDEYELKNNRMIDMDMMSEESPSEYSSTKYTSSDTILSMSPPPHFFNQNYPFSAPTHMNYFSSFNNTSIEDYESFQLKQQALNEKKRQRRESHNAVERRRRENINERIQELGTMLPEDMLQEIINPQSNNSRPNKGAILRKSVDHIRLLQEQVSIYQQRIIQLESQLSNFI